MRTLREHRRSRYLTIEALASASGVSPKTIVETEHGRTVPKFRTILALSKALGVEPGEVAEFAAVVAEPDTKRAA
jgi:transcriptional regulator with XRE-family HTH domain